MEAHRLTLSMHHIRPTRNHRIAQSPMTHGSDMLLTCRCVRWRRGRWDTLVSRHRSRYPLCDPPNPDRPSILPCTPTSHKCHGGFEAARHLDTDRSILCHELGDECVVRQRRGIDHGNLPIPVPAPQFPLPVQRHPSPARHHDRIVTTGSTTLDAIFVQRHRPLFAESIQERISLSQPLRPPPVALVSSHMCDWRRLLRDAVVVEQWTTRMHAFLRVGLSCVPSMSLPRFGSVRYIPAAFPAF